MPSAGGLVLEQGRVLAKKYVLVRPAGFGGMAQLWVATNESTGAEVCIKMLVPDPEKGGHDEELVERFRREAHAAASLSHRAIVRVFDLLELDESGAAIPRGKERAPHAYAMVMELLRGETLGDVLAKRGKLPLEEALDLFLPIVSALGHAHRADVIHRDLKPDNIFLATEPDGHVIPKVLDFGVSKLGGASEITIDGVLVGTPGFMSPEQAKGSRQIDARSDVFSAGILLYTMLGGRNPFEDAPTFASIVDAVLRRQVSPLPDVPAPIWEVIDRAIAKDPAQRFDGATEMSIALRKAAGRKAQTESEPMIAVPLPPPSPRQSLAQASSIRPKPAPSVTPPALDATGDRASSDAAGRRRAMVAGVLGVAAALIVAASMITFLGPKVGTDAGASSSPSPGHERPSAVAPAASIAAPSATAEAPPATPEPATSPPAEPTSSASADPAMVPVKPTATPAHGTAAPKRAPTGSPRAPATPPTRRPGEEPHKARDPGF